MNNTVATLFCLLVLMSLIYDPAEADSFEVYGLEPAAVIMKDADPVLFATAMRVAERMGAKGLLGLPPTMIFGRFPPGTGADDFEGIDVQFFTEAADIDPMETDLVTLKAARGLLEEKKILDRTPPFPTVPFVDRVLEVPREIVEKTRPSGLSAIQGTPTAVTERAINQNSEFLMGNVLVNLILPESVGDIQSEDWTADEISDVIRDVLLGLSQYEQASLWAQVSFTLNCPALHQGVPVFWEPIEGNWETDYIWVAEAIRYLSIHYDIDLPPSGSVLEMVHTFNNAQRARYVVGLGEYFYDWVFTSFIADASVNVDECWGGVGYAAYSYLGGPYLICCYPACGFGTGIGFGHVFIHEMSHTFWALDEYASAAAFCNDRSGYLNYRNGNSYYMECGEGMPCIMNNWLLTAPLPICRYTMGQVGLADDNENSIPDLYEVEPIVEVAVAGPDTTFDGTIPVSIEVHHTPVPNMNPLKFEEDRIDYAPHLIRAKKAINNGLWENLPGSWEEIKISDINYGLLLHEGLRPGDNWIHIKFWNHVELSGIDSTKIYYVGIDYEEAMAIASMGQIAVEWKVPLQTFGADFMVYRQNLTDDTPLEMIASVDCDSIYEENISGKRYCYVDENIVSGYTYRYQIIGEIKLPDRDPMQYPSNNMIETAMVPIASGFVSQPVPNPTSDKGSTISVEVPKSYYNPSGTYVTSDGPLRAPSVIETGTKVLVEVFDVAGRKVRSVYDLNVFGGKIITITWDGYDDKGRMAATGVYFMRVKAGSGEEVRKVVIIR